MKLCRRLSFLLAGMLCLAGTAGAQPAQRPATAAGPAPAAPVQTPASEPSPSDDRRAQYPAFLANSYFSANVGYMQYGFSGRQLQSGYQVERVQVPHAAARVMLFGHEFSRFFAAQVTYMRPVNYVTYQNVNGDQSPHHVLVHFGAATVRPQLPIHRRVSLYGEAGLGITSRRGFEVDGVPAITDTTFASLLFGGGIDLHVTDNWDLVAGMTYSPENVSRKQPRTILWSGGFRFNMRPLPPERVAENAARDGRFRANLLQVEYTTGVGYGINTFLSTTVPVFWGGVAKVAQGGAVHYQRNVFHTRKVFAFDLGASGSLFKSRGNEDHFVALSVYPLLRWTVLRTAPADLYVFYSLAGPSYISKVILDGEDTGRHFTFQDFLGVGSFLGRSKHLNAGVKINHYSNGNIFTANAGVKVPLTLFVGYAF